MKKIIFLLMCMFTIGVANAQIEKYDLNGDGQVNTGDVVKLYNYITTGVDDILTFQANGVYFKMIAVDGGIYQMGVNEGYSDGQPAHGVTLSSFYIGQTEVTQALWTAVMGSNPSYFFGDNLPVERVSWDDCQDFIEKLNKITGENFRLPTEAEWEFAAKGGVKSKGYLYSGSDCIDDVAWYYDNSNNTTHAVASKAPNELGIYDMSGNVWEWCQDYWGYYPNGAQVNPTGPDIASGRMYRGGSWNGYALYCRSFHRNTNGPTYSINYIGLRLAK